MHNATIHSAPAASTILAKLHAAIQDALSVRAQVSELMAAALRRAH